MPLAQLRRDREDREGEAHSPGELGLEDGRHERGESGHCAPAGPLTTAVARRRGRHCPEICLLLVIDDMEWLRREPRQRRPFRFGWEYAQTPQRIRHRSTGRPDHWSLRLDADLRPANGLRLDPSYLVPDAAAAIDLAVGALAGRS
ncbi:hypothetical protein [Streptomyces yangpuensis]|uniref:hypothetical protein n=1 Tax=Streptomyces yangpuensis TaxID=1648182 RepID=UPI003663A14D